MGAHPKAYARLHARLAATRDPTERDAVLDRILAARDQATEWDADRWGFDPDRWMEAERVELASRAGGRLTAGWTGRWKPRRGGCSRRCGPRCCCWTAPWRC